MLDDFMQESGVGITFVIPSSFCPGSGGGLGDQRLEMRIRCLENIDRLLYILPDIGASIYLEPARNDGSDD